MMLHRKSLARLRTFRRLLDEVKYRPHRSTSMFSLSALEKHDEGSAVIARDHTEDDRSVEIDDRAADFGAVLELDPAQ